MAAVGEGHSAYSDFFSYLGVMRGAGHNPPQEPFRSAPCISRSMPLLRYKGFLEPPSSVIWPSPLGW